MLEASLVGERADNTRLLLEGMGVEGSWRLEDFPERWTTRPEDRPKDDWQYSQSSLNSSGLDSRYIGSESEEEMAGDPAEQKFQEDMRLARKLSRESTASRETEDEEYERALELSRLEQEIERGEDEGFTVALESSKRSTAAYTEYLKAQAYHKTPTWEEYVREGMRRTQPEPIRDSAVKELSKQLKEGGHAGRDGTREYRGQPQREETMPPKYNSVEAALERSKYRSGERQRAEYRVQEKVAEDEIRADLERKFELAVHSRDTIRAKKYLAMIEALGEQGEESTDRETESTKQSRRRVTSRETKGSTTAVTVWKPKEDGSESEEDRGRVRGRSPSPSMMSDSKDRNKTSRSMSTGRMSAARMMRERKKLDSRGKEQMEVRYEFDYADYKRQRQRNDMKQLTTTTRRFSWSNRQDYSVREYIAKLIRIASQNHQHPSDLTQSILHCVEKDVKDKLEAWESAFVRSKGKSRTWGKKVKGAIVFEGAEKNDIEGCWQWLEGTVAFFCKEFESKYSEADIRAAMSRLLLKEGSAEGLRKLWTEMLTLYHQLKEEHRANVDLHEHMLTSIQNANIPGNKFDELFFDSQYEKVLEELEKRAETEEERQEIDNTDVIEEFIQQMEDIYDQPVSRREPRGQSSTNTQQRSNTWQRPARSNASNAQGYGHVQGEDNGNQALPNRIHTNVLTPGVAVNGQGGDKFCYICGLTVEQCREMALRTNQIHWTASDCPYKDPREPYKLGIEEVARTTQWPNGSKILTCSRQRGRLQKASVGNWERSLELMNQLQPPPQQGASQVGHQSQVKKVGGR